MGNRIFVAIVVLLWIGTMSWLMVARILPPFFHGDPPEHVTQTEEAPNCWQITMGQQRVGYAVSQAIPGDMGTTEIHSRVKLEGVQLRKLLPFQVGSLLHGSGAIDLDMRARMAIDSLSNLTSFDTRVQLNKVPLVMIMQGRVDGARLKVKLNAGEFTHEESFPVPASALVVNELLPESRLLNVEVGRKWQQESFSPFKASMEVVQGEVVEECAIDHRGEQKFVQRIEYRTLSAVGVSADNTLRSVVWVAEDGQVLRQDLHLIGVMLRFERCSEPHMIEYARQLLDVNAVATVPLTGE